MLKQVRQRIQEQGCQAFISSNMVSRRYLTNFTGSAGFVWIDEKNQILITDFRYTEQAQEQSPEWQIIQDSDPLTKIAALAKEYNVSKVAFESEYVTVDQFSQWESRLGVDLIPTKDLILDYRMVKTVEEIELITKAVQITDEAFANTLPLIKPGVQEMEIALELEYQMKKLGASGLAFDAIVASGPRGALPHATPGQRKFTHGDFIVMDFGCSYQGYCSDMTRTLLIGEPSDKHLAVYNLVLKAQLAGLAGVKPGRTGQEVDQIARDIISEAGYGDNFGHSLGHGVGLEIHEEPRLSKTGEHVLKPGMVVTVEPGVYLSGWGGVRIEDLVVVTETGCRILTATPKDLHIIA